MLSDVNLILMAAIVRAKNELVRVAVKLDPPRMKPAEKLVGPYRHTEVYTWPIRAMIALHIQIFIEITA